MGFLNPLWLVGMVSAGIPLVIHLIGRRRESKVDFSSLRLLREVDRRRNLWLKLKRILLLLLRMAICAGIFFLLARPVVNLKYGAFTHAPTAACVVIDDSPSMGAAAGQVFMTAKRKALEILSHFSERDEVFVLTTSLSAELGPSNDPVGIRAFVSELNTSHRMADLKPVIDRAKALLTDSKKVNKAVYLISDLQTVNFSGLKKADLERIVIMDVSRDIQNVGITDVASEELFSPRGSASLRITLRNYSSSESTRDIGVWLDDEKIQVMEVKLSGSSDAMVDVDISVETPGYHSGYVKLMEDDDLLFDDSRYFTLQVPAEIPVLIVSDDLAEGNYLARALRPKPEVFTPFEVDLISPREMLKKDVLSYEVIALNDVRSLDFGQLKMLQKYSESGGRTCIFLGGRIDADFYNMTILSEFETHVNAMVRLPEPGFVSIARIELTHPVFSPFREKRFGDLSLSKFHSYFSLETLPAQILGRFSNGEPAVVESPERGVLLAFSLGDSDITKKAIFVPFMHRLFYHLAKKEEVPKGVLVGEKLKMGTPEVFRNTTCTTPEDEHIRIIPKLVSGETVITFSETDRPGIYRVEADGVLLAMFPVNVDPQESQTAKLSAPELDGIFGTKYWLSETGEVVVELGLRSYELTKLILWIVLGLVFLEVFLVQRR